MNTDYAKMIALLKEMGFHQMTKEEAKKKEFNEDIFDAAVWDFTYNGSRYTGRVIHIFQKGACPSRSLFCYNLEGKYEQFLAPVIEKRGNEYGLSDKVPNNLKEALQNCKTDETNQPNQ